MPFGNIVKKKRSLHRIIRTR